MPLSCSHVGWQGMLLTSALCAVWCARVILLDGFCGTDLKQVAEAIGLHEVVMLHFKDDLSPYLWQCGAGKGGHYGR